jgi:ribonuclease P protein component
MLPAGLRMRRRADFAATLRRGPRAARAGRSTLVVHLAGPGGDPCVGSEEEALIGLVVPRAVGGAVTRNRVKRRLRSLVRERLARLPGGSRLVVRAQPPAASASYAVLADDLDGALDAAVARLGSACTS